MGEWQDDKEDDMIMIDDDDYDVYEWYDLLVSVCMDASPPVEGILTSASSGSPTEPAQIQQHPRIPASESVNSLHSWSAFEAVHLHASLPTAFVQDKISIFLCKMTSKFIMSLTISTCTQPPMKRQTHRWPKEDYSSLFLWTTWQRP